MTITKLGRYEIIEKLGEGATSEVYLARDSVLGRQVALKVLKPSLVTDASAFGRFANEAQAAAALFHPSIATVLDMGESEGRYFIAMRYIAGRSLDQVIKEDGPLPWEQVLQMSSQIGGALGFAHKAGFLHRDVKPSNIIQAESGDYVLTDFGLTRAMMNTGLTSHTGAVLGTPSYIAPEIWLSQTATQASDQYALACVIVEALSGKILFTGETPPAIMTGHMVGQPRLSDTWPEAVPQGMNRVLGKALEKIPENRYPELSGFVAALEGLASGHAATDTAALATVERQRIGPPKKLETTADTSRPKGSQGTKLGATRWLGIAIAIAVIVLVAGLSKYLPAVLIPAATPSSTTAPVVTSLPSSTAAPLLAPTSAASPAASVTPASTLVLEPTLVAPYTPTSRGSLEVTVLDRIGRDLLATKSKYGDWGDPAGVGKLWIDLGIRLRNLDEGTSVGVTWDELTIIQPSGGPQVPEYGGWRTTGFGDTVDTASLGRDRLSYHPEGIQIPAHGSTFFRLFYRIPDPKRQILQFAFDGVPLASFTVGRAP